MSLPTLTLPNLSPRFATALQACTSSLFDLYDVQAILASGTIVRESPDSRSDLDIHVLHRGDFRERRQVFFGGVPCEIFVNPERRIRRYFIDEAADRTPITAHMFATGKILYDPEQAALALTELAKISLKHPPAPDSDALIAQAYGAATLLEDALDLSERWKDAALVLLGRAVWDLAMCRVAFEPGWLPRPKDLLTTLGSIDPDSADLVVVASAGPEFEKRLDAARELCRRVTKAEGFFEWTSPRELILETSTAPGC